MRKTALLEIVSRTEWTSVSRILEKSPSALQHLREEVDALYRRAFPKMPEAEHRFFADDIFTQPLPESRRVAGLFRDDSSRLFAAAVFDSSAVPYRCRNYEAVYLLSRAVLPECQGMGIGKRIALRLMEDFSPDILISTCGQSSALHSWIRLVEKGRLRGYEAFPRLCRREGENRLISLPDEKIGFALSAFRVLFSAIVGRDRGIMDRVLEKTTVQMVRKGLFHRRYDFDPWRKNGKKDALAAALNLTEGDGVLVTLIKKGEDSRKKGNG